MTILAKTYFASPLFTMEKTVFPTIWQKPANPVFKISNRCAPESWST